MNTNTKEMEAWLVWAIGSPLSGICIGRLECRLVCQKHCFVWHNFDWHDLHDDWRFIKIFRTFQLLLSEFTCVYIQSRWPGECLLLEFNWTHKFMTKIVFFFKKKWLLHWLFTSTVQIEGHYFHHDGHFYAWRESKIRFRL